MCKMAWKHANCDRFANFIGADIIQFFCLYSNTAFVLIVDDTIAPSLPFRLFKFYSGGLSLIFFSPTFTRPTMFWQEICAVGFVCPHLTFKEKNFYTCFYLLN